MKKRILFVGYRGKSTHLSKNNENFLLINKGEFKLEYENSFSKIWKVNDIFDWEEVRSVLAKSEFDAVLTRFEDFIVPTAAIAEAKKLPGISLEKSVNFRNKFLMKQVFAEQKVPAADFVLIDSMEKAEEFLTCHKFPLILKQLSGVHSRFVAKVKSREDLAQTLRVFQEEIQNEMATLHDQLFNHEKIPTTPDPRTHFLLEELLVGEELSIDALTVNGKHHFTPICRYVTSEEIGISDHHLPIRILPADYTPEQESIIYNTVKKALDALGTNFCGSHTEVFFKRETNECSVVEVAARSGGFRGEMFDVATQRNFDLNEICIQVALGDTISLPEKYPVYTAVVEIFSPNIGKLDSIDFSCLKNRDDIKNITLNRKNGEMVGPASRGGKFIMKFLVYGKEFQQTLNNATKLLHEIRNSIRLQE